MIDNFGLDDQLQILFKGVRDKKFFKSLFKEYPRFDVQKLRL